jgi:hypothetical protein
MLIKTLIKRDGGSKVDIDSITYDFQPDSDGCHVCDVTEAAHVELLLSIAEGYAKKEAVKPIKQGKTA